MSANACSSAATLQGLSPLPYSSETLAQEITLHHVGVVVADIDRYLQQSVWERRTPIVIDPLQQSRLCLTSFAVDATPMIELVEPLGETSPTWGALQRGGGWHHLCFAVGTQAAGDALVRERRLLPVGPWQPAVLFDGRAVRFVYSRNRELLELLADAE
jgi:glyoxalase/bleomycin resistance protein/dioxygenase superfamily protein